MNYLGHAILSGNDENLIVGNFIADHLRGNLFSNLPPQIIEGIKLHRSIDLFTDNHEMFKLTKRFFYPEFEKYSGILVDMFFDHLLAKHFNNYLPQSIESFAKNIYKIYSNNIAYFPLSAKNFYTYLIKNNVYVNYSSVAGISKILEHLSLRIKHKVLLQNALPIFLKNESLIQNNFHIFIHEAKNTFLHD